METQCLFANLRSKLGKQAPACDETQCLSANLRSKLGKQAPACDKMQCSSANLRSKLGKQASACDETQCLFANLRSAVRKKCCYCKIILNYAKEENGCQQGSEGGMIITLPALIDEPLKIKCESSLFRFYQLKRDSV